MKKLARVQSSDPASGTARITIFKHMKCSGCGACEQETNPLSDILAENLIKAEAGHYVTVNAKKRFSLKAFLITVILPVLLFFSGLALGTKLFPGSAGGVKAIILAFIGLAVALMLVWRWRRSYRPEWQARITGLCAGPDSTNTYKSNHL